MKIAADFCCFEKLGLSLVPDTALMNGPAQVHSFKFLWKGVGDVVCKIFNFYPCPAEPGLIHCKSRSAGF